MRKSNKYYIPLILVLTLAAIPLTYLANNNSSNDLRSKASEGVAKRCARSNPFLDINPKQQEGKKDQSLQYTLTIRNNDSPECSVSDFYVSYFNLEENWSQDPKYFEVKLKPGESTKKIVSIRSPNNAKSGAHPFTELVREGISDSDRSYETKATAIYMINKGPKINILSPANKSVLNTSQRLTINTSCSSNTNIKRMELYMDNKVIRTCLSTSVCATMLSTNALGNGQHIIKANCVDNDGQNATDSVTVTKQTLKINEIKPPIKVLN